jgi:diaminopimelate decarboxylase
MTKVTPSLVFDLARVEANLVRFARAAKHAQITPLFALKSFPLAAVRELAAAHLAGFDAASPGEIAQLAPRTDRILSVADPSGAGIATTWPGRLIVGVETPEQAARAPANAELAIRLSASFGDRDPAVGAILDGTGRRRSRFGLDVDRERRRASIRAIVAAAAGRPVGVHVHHGPVAATSAERFIATATDALADVDARFIDLGGAWHAVADLPGALAAIRAAIPASIEVIVEPGRLFADGAGFAHGTVVAARALDDRELRVLDVSRICHLRWSQLSLVAPPPRPGAGRPTAWVGPTCYEEDVLGDWIVEPDRFPAGAPVVLAGVTGYALAWNTGFAGIPPAVVITR